MQPQGCNSSRPKVAPSPKTPHDTFRQHDLCEQSASRRADRRAIALRASTAQSLRDCFAQDDTREELSVNISLPTHPPLSPSSDKKLLRDSAHGGEIVGVEPSISLSCFARKVLEERGGSGERGDFCKSLLLPP